MSARACCTKIKICNGIRGGYVEAVLTNVLARAAADLPLTEDEEKKIVEMFDQHGAEAAKLNALIARPLEEKGL